MLIVVKKDGKLRVGVIIVILMLLGSCNPYERYPCTHYFIQATIDPENARISANVQMVFSPTREYHDSICFSLNPGMEIHSLTAQELKFYEIYERDSGNLVLYIQEPVFPSEQIHIALSYAGELVKEPISGLYPDLFWYPVNRDSSPATFQAKFALPGEWKIEAPPTGMGKHGKWLFESRLPQSSLSVIFTRR